MLDGTSGIIFLTSINANIKNHPHLYYIMFSDAFVSIMVSDMAKALNFYSKILGMKIEFKSKYWSELSGPGIWIGLHASDKKGKKIGRISIGFVVKDIHKEINILNKKKIKVSSIDEEDYGSFAYFCDPDGNDLYFYEEKK